MPFVLAIIGVLLGITLGLRFKVFVLAPAIGFAEISTLMVGLARSDRFGSMVLAMVVVWLAIQLGYLFGVFLAKRIW